MKAVAGLFIFQVTLTLAANFSPYRGKCTRFGKFDTRIEGSVLAGHVISSSQVSTRIDCTFECLSKQRCSSYNYQEGEGDVHDCELNSESKETKPLNLTEKAGYSYYGTGQNVPSACKSSPCINDGTCEESCMEGTGYKCVCIDGRTGDKCQQWTSTAQDYEVLFPKKSITDYIETDLTETLPQFTLCYWVKRATIGWTAFFDLQTPNNNTDLRFTCGPQMWRCWLLVVTAGKQFDLPPVVNDMWQHICVRWENVNGTWDVIVNGAVTVIGSAFRKAMSVRPGKLIIGQRQSFYDGGFVLSDSFQGKMAAFNIWNIKMVNSEIAEMARSCSQTVGNVIDWRMFRHGIHGDAEIMSPQSCVSHVAESEFVLDFPARDVNDYVETSILPTLNKFTLSFWMKRGFDGFLHGAILSYATAQGHNSIHVTLGDTGALNMRVMGSSTLGYYEPPIVDDLWHHLAITWTNMDGQLQVFLDGVLKYTRTGYRVGVSIPGGGTLRIGQLHRSDRSNDPNRSYRGKFAKLNMWSSVLDGSAIVALFRSPGAENGDVIAWKDMRTALINGNVMVQELASLQLIAQENDFGLIFPAKSSANYAKYTTMPSLTALTVCFWVTFSDISDDQFFFSYSTSSSNQAITMGYLPSTLRVKFNINAADWQYYTLSSSIHDNGWHQLCVTWKNSDGRLCRYLDGTKLSCITGYKTGQTIPGNGKFILGQEQHTNSTPGSFNSAHAYYGWMSRLNVWSFETDQAVIKQMSRGCGLWSGDAVAWYYFKDNIIGNVEIATPSSCSLAVYTLQAKRDAYCQDRYSSVDCGPTIRALFERKQNQVGKRWRCMYGSALTQDSHTMMPVYDTTKLSGCLHSITADLLGVTEQ